MSCPSAITVLDQRINANLTLTQTVEQSNSSFQGVAVAVAIGRNSEAVASQEAEQCNKNLQEGSAIAINRAANLCGEIVDKSKSPDAEINAERTEAQENDYTQIASVAISIDGGQACAEQTVSQSNSNNQNAFLQAEILRNPCENQRKQTDGSKPERKVHNFDKSETHKTKAVAYTGRYEKARVVIDLGRYKLELMVTRDGDVYLNNKKIKHGKRY